MSETTNYQCPHCLGPLHFSSQTGKLQCEYCGSSFTPEELGAVDKKAVDATFQADEFTEFMTEDAWGEEARKMRAYSCTSCGAQLICDETTAATSCPYCGNPTIMPGQFHGILKPDQIIPFKLSKEDAVKALQAHYRKKLLLPKVFANENHIQEIKGIYVPFWLFDFTVHGTMTFSGTRTHTHREGNYRVTSTEHYRLYRDGSMGFQKVPVDGSKKMPDALMDSIEPYNYKDLVPFSTAYLPGFLADKYDVEAKTSYKRASKRSETSAMNAMRNTVTGYGDVRITNNDLRIKENHRSYALLPVWLLTTKWKDKTYLFAMNGQTRKMVGDLPIDMKKRAMLYWSTFLVSGAILSLTCSGILGKFFFSLLMILFS